MKSINFKNISALFLVGFLGYMGAYFTIQHRIENIRVNIKTTLECDEIAITKEAEAIGLHKALSCGYLIVLFP